ncbi:MAG: hypothetical protein ACSHYF_06130 [Verrucomicrobiaceae bacterium]
MKLLPLLFLLLCINSNAQSFRGPLPQEQRDIIHFMAEHHKELNRKVTITPTGYRAETTSDNKELVAKLKTHVAYMEKRLDSGAMVRRWDPAYAEMVEHYDHLDATITPLKNGIKIIVVGKNPRAIKVAQNHARIVSSFVKEGAASVEREHPDTTSLDKKQSKNKSQ